MAKVLFINPVVRQEDDPKHVPYGIALLAAIAMRDGHLVQVYDENAWRRGPDVLRQVLEADDWDVVATGGITTAYASIKSLCATAREVCPRAVVVLALGASKAEIVARALTGPITAQVPGSLLQSIAARVTWLLDPAAASGLS